MSLPEIEAQLLLLASHLNSTSDETRPERPDSSTQISLGECGFFSRRTNPSQTNGEKLNTEMVKANNYSQVISD